MKRDTAAVWLMLLAPLHAGMSATPAPNGECPTDLDQTFEWDDAGTNWPNLPFHEAVCPGEEPRDPRWGGSTRIQVRGNDATVVQDSYSWIIDPKGDLLGPCWHVRRSTSRRSRTLKGGVLSEVSESTERPTQQSEKPYPPPRKIAVGGSTTLPKANDAYLDRVGEGMIAGHACHRVSPKTNAAAGGARFEMCIYELPRSCPLSAYVQPLEFTITQPDGQVTTHGITTSLQFSAPR